MKNGREYIVGDLNDWLTEENIIPENSPTYHPELNGQAERLNRTLLNKKRAMINTLGPRHKKLWSDEVSAASDTGERMFSNWLEKYGVTIVEALTGIKPEVPNLRHFRWDT